MVLISESMNLMSSTTSKSGSKWSWGFRGVRSVTEGGEQELEVAVASKLWVFMVLLPVFGEDKVTSSRSVGKAPPLWPPLASLLHQGGLTSCWWPPFCCCCCWSKLRTKKRKWKLWGSYSRLSSLERGKQVLRPFVIGLQNFCLRFECSAGLAVQSGVVPRHHPSTAGLAGLDGLSVQYRVVPRHHPSTTGQTGQWRVVPRHHPSTACLAAQCVAVPRHHPSG